MNKEQRVNEIFSQITAFVNDHYSKEEFLPELLKLQQEYINLTYNLDHAENGNLRLWDVEKHFEKLNEERGHIADKELEKFIQGSKIVCNTIKSEFSGNIGEHKVFRELDTLSCQNGVLHNVELEFDGKRTEIDAIVFTSNAVFIIEIKNTKKDIFIDENGDFFRIGNSMHCEGNIAEKMDEREAMLRKALERAGMEYMKIFKIVTFTNRYVDVECKYRYIKVCPANYLTHFIENFKSDTHCSYEDICTMMTAVEEVKCQETYQMSIDMTEYKQSFANLMATLEMAEDNQEDTNSENVNETCTTEQRASKTVKQKSKTAYNLGMSAAAAAVSIVVINAAVFACRKLLK